MALSDLIAQAKAAAVASGLDPALVCAVCDKESSWNQWAIRAEPAFDERYIQPLHKTPTEEWARSISWGLMQLMGESARERGYLGDLPTLCQADIGLHWGCAHLKFKLGLAGGDVQKGLQYWNGGGDPNYAEDVMSRMQKYQLSV